MINEIIEMFSNLGVISIVCLLVGVILCIIEIIIPGFGVCGILGIFFNLFAVVFQIIIGGSIAQVLLILGTVIVILMVILFFAIRSFKSGVLSKTALVEKSTSLPIDFAENSKNFGFLVGQEGLTVTICKPVGRVQIDDKIYQVISIGKYLNRNVKVKVFEVDGASIFVKEV